MWKLRLVYQPTHKIWMAFNEKPTIDDPSVGMWSRVRLIPFENCFSGREDRSLLEKLKAEAPGILNWAIEGALMWQEEGLRMPEKIRQATEEYQAESNVAMEFVRACCVMDPAAKVSNPDLHPAYKEWATTNGKTLLGESWFGRMLKGIPGIEQYRDGEERGWRGLRLKE
jgi:putative DNA primase/helicase